MTNDISILEDPAASLERDRQVLRLRLAGAADYKIATQLGISENDVRQAMIRNTGGVTPDARSRMRNMELMRADEIQAAFWVKAMKGDTDAAVICFRASELRSKLFGLFVLPSAPTGNVTDQPQQTTTDRIRAAVDGLMGKKDRTIDGEVVEHEEPRDG
jgi:hypothetical protein